MTTASTMRSVVPRAVVPGFLDAVDAALARLGEILEAPLAFGRAVRAVERLRGTLACVRYLHGWPERFTMESSFTLSVADPGFPSFKDVWLVEDDRAQAAEKLAVLPAGERIAESAVRDIRAGRFPLVWQRALVQRRYYERLLRTAVVSGFEVGTPRLGTGSKERPLHGLDWCGLAADDTQFVYQSLEFATDAGVPPPAHVEPTGELYKTLRLAFREDVASQFDHLETLHDVNPRVLTRLIVGPFHCNRAVPAPAVPALGDDPGAWMLECSLERLERGLIQEADARPAVQRTAVVICREDVKERLGEAADTQVFGVGVSA